MRVSMGSRAGKKGWGRRRKQARKSFLSPFLSSGDLVCNRLRMQDVLTLDRENKIPNTWKLLKTGRGFWNLPPGNPMP